MQNQNVMHCPQCNSLIEPGASFCVECGYRLPDTNSVPDASNINTPAHMAGPGPLVNPPQQIPYVQMPNQNYGNRRKKSSAGLIIGIAAAVIVLVAAVIATRSLWSKPPKPSSAAPSDIKIEKKEVSPPKASYESLKIIRPALYQCTDYLVYLKATSEEEKEMLLTVEVPGFTQKYEQKIMLKPQELKLKIRPPLIEGILNTLNTSKETQIKVTLQDTATQKYIIQDSKPVTILSKYDMKWVSDDGKETYYQNICAWVTPESPKIKELLRNSINQLSSWSKGEINAIVGYQRMGSIPQHQVSYFQVAAIFQTLRSHYNVRYNATPVSTSGSEAQQRIALPEDVIRQKSGLCIETAITMASAIEATGMHPMILILPGHAQIAFESWADSGEYYIMETTALTESNWDNIMIYLDKSQWTNYLNKNQVTVIDVELARKDGIKPME